MFLQLSFSGLFGSYLLETLILVVIAFFIGFFVKSSSSKPKEKKPAPVKEERNPYEQQLIDWSNKYQVAASNHEKTLGELRAKLQAAEDRANTFLAQHITIKSELENIKADSKQWTERIARIREEKDLIEEKFHASEKNLHHFETKYNELNIEIQAHGQAEDWHKKYNELINEKEKSKLELQKLKEMIDARDRRVIDLLCKDALAKDFRNKFEEAHKIKEHLGARVTELEQQLLQSDGVHTQLTQEHQSLQQKLAQVQKDAMELQERLKTVATTQQSTEQHEQKLKTAKEELSELQQRYEAMEKNLLLATREKDELQNEMNRIRSSQSMLSSGDRGEESGDS